MAKIKKKKIQMKDFWYSPVFDLGVCGHFIQMFLTPPIKFW